MCSSFITVLSRAAVMVFPIKCRLFCSNAAMNRQMMKMPSVLNKKDDLQLLMKVKKCCHHSQIKNDKWNIHNFGRTSSEKAAMNSSVGCGMTEDTGNSFGAKWNDSISTRHITRLTSYFLTDKKDKSGNSLCKLKEAGSITSEWIKLDLFLAWKERKK